MIDLLSAQSFSEAAALVLAALQRSVSRTQARMVAEAFVTNSSARILVIINPNDSHAALINEWKQRGAGKLVLFGRLPKALHKILGLELVRWPDGIADWSCSTPAPVHDYAESAGSIVYTQRAASLNAAHWKRALERFDFADEWNNLGYGAIRSDVSHWGLAEPLFARGPEALANVEVKGECVAAYVVLHDESTCSTLWFNRAVGPIDSFEWRMVENFLSSWRHNDLPCQPVLADIPWECEAAVTMRLDCDEDVESARSLRAVYHELKVPFSLAVHTSNLRDPVNHALLKQMAAAGESILSHTATHAPNWGGGYEAALEEGRESAALLESVTGKRVRYAVSPFHQTPFYALAGLVDAGFLGCIGGIIRNDPEFVLARGGILAGLPEGFIGHSQQHMLHGDCLLKDGDPIAVSKQAFDIALGTGTLFGYLDHPFSPRYQYGWLSESKRIDTHRSFIEYIRSKAPGVRFLSEEQAMDFLLMKSQWQVFSDDAGFLLIPPASHVLSPLLPAIEYAGRRFEAKSGRLAA